MNDKRKFLGKLNRNENTETKKPATECGFSCAALPAGKQAEQTIGLICV